MRRVRCSPSPAVGAMLWAFLSLALPGLAPRVLAQAVYVPNYTTNNISAYLLDPASGMLSTVAGSPFVTGTSPIQALVHPSGKFLYVLDEGSGDISLYSISAPSGALTFTGCPLCASVSPSGMTIDPAGQYLFVTNSRPGTVTPYLINSVSGVLTPMAPASTGADSNPVQPIVDPSGRYLYVADSGKNKVSGFAINPAGSLTAIPGSPFAAGSGPQSVAVSRSGVFVANQYSADVSVYQIGQGGTLIPAGSAVPAGGSPVSIAVDPTGNFVYVANQLQLVAFNMTPNGIYPLSQVQTYSAGTTPSTVTVDPSGSFVYAAGYASNDISGFAISAGGRLVFLGKFSTFSAAGPKPFAVHDIGDTTAISITAPYPVPANRAAYGSAVEFRGTVIDTLNPGVVPRGSVTFTINGEAVANGAVTLDASGGFSLIFDGSTQYLPMGANVIRIAYNPGVGFQAPAPTAIAYTVTKAKPSFSIAFSPVSPVAGQPLNVTVSAQQAAGRYPSGPITVWVDGAIAANSLMLTNGNGTASYTPIAGDHGIKVDYAGDTWFSDVSAGPITFHARRQTKISLTSSAVSLVYAQNPTLSATISNGGAAVTGTVDYYDGAVKIGLAPVASINGQYSAELSTPKFISLGEHAITVVYSGDADNASSNSNATPLVLTVLPAAVSVSTPVVSGTQSYGQPLTFTAAVAAAPPGGGVPSGTLSFKDNGKTVGSAGLTSGTGSLTISTLSAGSHTITASYGGDTNFLTGDSTGGALLTIAPASAELSVVAAPSSPLVYGQAVTLTTTLAGPPATGAVDFSDGETKIGSATLVGNRATICYKPTAVGSYAIKVTYNGDAGHNGSSSSIALVVNQAAVNVSAPSTFGTLAAGLPLTVTVAVSAAAPGSGMPSGAVTFRDGTTVLGTTDLAAGAASFTIASVTPGVHAITATYTGDANFTSGASPIFQVNTARQTPTVALNADVNSPVSGQTVTLTATLGADMGRYCTGMMDFFDNGTKLNAGSIAVRAGQAQLVYTVRDAGVHTNAAYYSGDANCNPASSSAAPLNLQIGQAWSSVSTPTVSGTLRFGQPVTFTAMVSIFAPATGTPTGVAVFKDGTATLGTAVLSGGIARLTTSALSAGAHSIRVSYSGDNNCAGSLSPVLTLTEEKALTTANLTASQTYTSTALRVTVSASGPNTPTGTVQFLSGTSVLANVPVTSGAANLESGPLSGVVTAIYSGDSNFLGSQTTTSLAAVIKPTTSLTLKISPNPAAVGQTIGFAITLMWSEGQTPGGKIQLLDGSAVLGTAIAGALTNFSIALNEGKHNILATYSGDGTYPPSSMTAELVVSGTPDVMQGNSVLSKDQ